MIGLDIDTTNVDYCLRINNKTTVFFKLVECINYLKKHLPEKYTVRVRVGKDITRGYEVLARPERPAVNYHANSTKRGY